ncbi:receptor-type tyrosine-protein phosphatase H isoform X3 [Manis pentadactyla]|uniref:receptor-type tyrosine-protein phosphatase H isoform X3 n=1 Tax=Manis pentadactyla TaxID=143292 RepID=UPI00255C843F|nr:receptor-type tyrosine-protein phosphatase H isoform X3 [Manis pentadactyla]
MTGTGGGLRAWGSLVLLSLCSWTGAHAAAPNPVRNLSVEAQTSSSISLRWEEPAGPEPQDYTYWVQCSGDGNNTQTQSTANTSVRVGGLSPGSVYELSVWAQRDGVPSSPETLSAPTAPNPVRNLSVEAQTTSSISLRWEEPAGPEPQDYTYWVQCSGDGNNTQTQSTANTSVRVGGLSPGSVYELSVWAQRNGVPSSPETLSAPTAPNPVRNLSVEAQTSSSISLRWEEPAGPEPQDYTYWVQCSGDGNNTQTQSTANTSVRVGGLSPGSVYELSVWAQRDGVPSSPETLSAPTAPNPVRNLSVEAQTTSSISLRWEEPAGPEPQDYTYWVQCSGDGNNTQTQSTANTSVRVGGLSPGSVYELSVWAQRDGVPSAPETLSAPTVPSAVTSLRLQEQTNSSITLSWTAPPGPQHPPHTYGVSWVKEGSLAARTHSSPDAGVTLEGLEAGSLYTFTVWAERNGVQSDNSTLTEATAPNEVTHLQNGTRSSSSVMLQWEAPEDPHSLLYTYWVQWTGGGHPQGERVTQGRQANRTSRTNETWYEVEALEPGTLYSFSVWAERNRVASSPQGLCASTDPDPVTITSCFSTSGGYGLVLNWSCPRGGREAFEFQVGAQWGSLDRSSCGRDVSVWGLQPAQSYPATVTTVWDGLRAPSAAVTCHTESAGVVAGAVVGALLLLILLGLLIFFLRKSSHKDILAEHFTDHVRDNEKDSNCGFAEEYQQLAAEGLHQAHTVASAPENSSKNRYRNVLPYDWSRVPLKPLYGEPGSDYINASFVPSLWSSQEFIAAQGPLAQTVGDFWRLVWEQQSSTLIMLTNCMESGRVKCEHYWPLDAQPCTHGHLQVVLMGEEVMENWTVRDLKLWHLQEQESLSVRQFHYTTWPDHGVPHSPDPLLAFWKVVRHWLDKTTGGGRPIVHCSAGVGRTGTLIALDVLLRQLEREGVVGPYGYVRKMRGSRPLMVQTEAQYVFLHHCILRFLQQPAPAPAKEVAADENLIYENVAAS